MYFQAGDIHGQCFTSSVSPSSSLVTEATPQHGGLVSVSLYLYQRARSAITRSPPRQEEHAEYTSFVLNLSRFSSSCFLLSSSHFSPFPPFFFVTSFPLAFHFPFPLPLFLVAGGNNEALTHALFFRLVGR